MVCCGIWYEFKDVCKLLSYIFKMKKGEKIKNENVNVISLRLDLVKFLYCV